MAFGLSAAAIGGIAAGAGALGAAYIGSQSAGNASDAASASAADSTAEQRRQFDAIQKLLSPYAQAGTTSLAGQQDLLGLNGNGAQQNAINGIQNSASFQSQLAQGENSIRQNASATGGLRGGNTQAALAQFSPALLNQNIQQQYSNLAGLTSLGQTSAAGLGTAGQNSANAITGINSQIGSIQSGAALAQGTAAANGLNGLASAFGGYLGASNSNPYSVGLGSAYGGSRQGL